MSRHRAGFSHSAGANRVHPGAVHIAFLALALVATRTSPSQTVDAFNPGASDSIDCVAFQPDGKILAGGWFTDIGGQGFPYLARLNPDGAVDALFNPAPDGPVSCLAIQADGSMVAGGYFARLNNQSRNHIGRLKPNGSVDLTFNPNANGAVYSVGVQGDGRILIGGQFTSVGLQPRNFLARLNSNGSLDTAFNPGANAAVHGLAIQPDGKIIVGGEFSTLGGLARLRLGRLNTNGAPDINFNVVADGTVYALALQPDGGVLAGGWFAHLAGQPRQGLGRLNKDGSLDPSFAPAANGLVNALALQTDGSLLAGGWFSVPTPTGLLRFKVNGLMDPGFTVATDANVHCVAIDAAGKILAGGTFLSLAGQPRSRIGRLVGGGLAAEQLTFDCSTLRWLRNGTGAEIDRVTFDTSTNGLDWKSLGSGTRSTDAWTLSGIALRTGTLVRARGIASPNGFCSWTVESLFPKTQPVIFTDDDSFGLRTNHFGFNIGASFGQLVIVQGSTNLSDWVNLVTNKMTATPFYFSDPQTGTFVRRCYRLLTP